MPEWESLKAGRNIKPTAMEEKIGMPKEIGKTREFNTTAVCIPSKHYMVDISEKVEKIKELVDSGKYFTINRARQYGKTTTLYALKKRLENEYTVLSLDFQSIGADAFKSEATFSQAMVRIIIDCYEFENIRIDEETVQGKNAI